jgi:hypothetical protein
MPVSRLLTLSLQTALLSIPAIAQSSTPAEPTAPHSPLQLHLNGQPRKFEFGQPSAQPGSNLFTPPQPVPNPFTPPQPPVNSFSLPRHLTNSLKLPQNTLIASAATSPRPISTCYAVRSYEYVRDNPTSDATRLAGSSTCLPAANVHAKAVVDPRIVLVR